MASEFQSMKPCAACTTTIGVGDWFESSNMGVGLITQGIHEAKIRYSLQRTGTIAWAG